MKTNFKVWNNKNFILHISKSLLVFFLVILPVNGKGQLLGLNEDTWQDLLEGEWMVEFFAPWCPACKQLDPVWNEFATWSEDLGIKVGNIDVTANPGLSGRFMVTALPTIYHVKDGVFRQYRGARDKDSFISFVEEKKWTNVAPVSSWKSPQSAQMSIVSCFFKLSMGLRNVHNKMVEEYGLPYWASYILFGLATIIIGAILGLIIVCIIDFVFPAKSLPPYVLTKDVDCLDKKDNGDKSNIPKGDEDDDEEDDDDDVIEDDDKQENQDLRQRTLASGDSKDVEEEN